MYNGKLGTVWFLVIHRTLSVFLQLRRTHVRQSVVGAAGQKSSTARKVEQRRSPWTWAGAGNPRFGETGHGATSSTAGLRALALPWYSGVFLCMWP